MLACVPVLSYEAVHGFTTDEEEKRRHIHNNWYASYVFFKLFKLLMLARISALLSFAERELKAIDYFLRDKITIENMFGYIRAAGEFFIMIHFFACLWLYVGFLKFEWMSEEERLLENKHEMYVNSVYYITTTMTSVGYGDISAFSADAVGD